MLSNTRYVTMYREKALLLPRLWQSWLIQLHILQMGECASLLFNYGSIIYQNEISLKKIT